LAATPIPLAMFVQSVAPLGEAAGELDPAVPPFGEGPAAELRVRKAVAELARYSMVKFDGQEITVHPLVQTVERAQVPAARRRDWLGRVTTILTTHAPINPTWCAGQEMWPRLLPHAETLWAQVGADEVAGDVDLLNLLSGCYYARSS